MYIVSLVFSFIVVIMTIIMTFIDEESNFFKFFGYTELYFLMGVSIVFLILGILIDIKKKDE